MKSFFKHNFFPFSRFIVADHSMEPEYKPGDHVLTFNWGRLQSGDVVVFIENRHPGGNVVTDKQSLLSGESRISGEILRSLSSDKRTADLRISSLDSIASLQNDKAGKRYKYLIKRVDRLDENLVFVSGDNTERSSKIGPVRLNQIIGKVILKY